MNESTPACSAMMAAAPEKMSRSGCQETCSANGWRRLVGAG
jgi:hypothetical protein